jgi:hypothetical protein
LEVKNWIYANMTSFNTNFSGFYLSLDLLVVYNNNEAKILQLDFARPLTLMLSISQFQEKKIPYRYLQIVIIELRGNWSHYEIILDYHSREGHQINFGAFKDNF